MSLRPKPVPLGAFGEERIDHVNRVGAANARLRTKAQSLSELSAALSETQIDTYEDVTPADQTVDFGVGYKGKHAVILPFPNENIVTPDFLKNVLLVFKNSSPEVRAVFRFNSRMTLSHTDPDGSIDIGECALLLSEALMKLVTTKETSCLPNLFEQVIGYCSSYESQFRELSGLTEAAKQLEPYFAVEPRPIPRLDAPLFHGLGMIPYPSDVDPYFAMKGLVSEYSMYLKHNSKLSSFEKKDQVDYGAMLYGIVKEIRGTSNSNRSQLYDIFVMSEAIFSLFNLASQVSAKMPKKLVAASVDNFKSDLEIKSNSMEAKGFEAPLARVKLAYAKVVTEAFF